MTAKILRKVLGAVLVIAGVAIAPLPGPLGLPLIFIGLSLLGYGPHARAFLRRVGGRIRAAAARWYPRSGSEQG